MIQGKSTLYIQMKDIRPHAQKMIAQSINQSFDRMNDMIVTAINIDDWIILFGEGFVENNSDDQTAVIHYINEINAYPDHVAQFDEPGMVLPEHLNYEVLTEIKSMFNEHGLNDELWLEFYDNAELTFINKQRVDRYHYAAL